MNRRAHQAVGRRRGVILVVVLLLLTLFAIVGLSFVLYADACANSARVAREAENPFDGRGGPEDIDPESLLQYFMGQVLTDASDEGDGLYSGLRGHSLGRSMYGMNYTIRPDGSFTLDPNQPDFTPNMTPYSGVGRSPTDALVNHTYFPADAMLRDPERATPRAGPRVPGTPDNRGAYVAWNVPYTYPDMNNVFLAKVDKDGNVLKRSFHRDETGFGPLAPTNPNWMGGTPLTKYQVLRPRPAEHMGFPAPEDPGGDVKNLVGGPGGNDSIWVDLGYPVVTTSNGRKFKALFAPLIIDLDNRINLNAHGNIRGDGGATPHLSQPGLGPWEVNLGRPFGNNEWVNLFKGGMGATGPVQGRYGSNGIPVDPGSPAPYLGPRPRFYAQLNYDGAAGTGPYSPAQVLQIPGPGTAWLSPGPQFDPASFGNATGAEMNNHPLMYSPVALAGDDTAFPNSDLEVLCRFGDTGTSTMTSSLFTLCPNTIKANAVLRRLLTTHSFDLTRPGVTPWVYGGSSYQLPPPPMGSYLATPTGGPLPFPSTAGAPPVTGNPFTSEFGPDWKAISAAVPKVNLNRPLPRYPAPDPTSNTVTDMTGFNVAQKARQDFAQDIYVRLRIATGAADPATATGPALDALRYLAQLAVNIVDYLDHDDYMTPFAWNPNSPTEYVYGTEMPRVVLNEVYVEFANDASPSSQWGTPNPLTEFKGHVWVELCNLFKDDPDPANPTAPERKGEALLENPSGSSPYPVYQVIMARSDRIPEATLRAPGNTKGDPLYGGNSLGTTLGTDFNVLGADDANFNAGTGPYFNAKTGLSTTGLPTGYSSVDTSPTGPNAGQPHVLRPADPSNPYAGAPRGNQGFYVLGPVLRTAGTTNATTYQERDPFSASAASPAWTLARPEMTYKITGATAGGALPGTSVVLRRLACPHLPFNATTNPYITVDYVLNVAANNAIEYSMYQNAGTKTTNAAETTTANRVGKGKMQPYASHASQLQDQNPTPPNSNPPFAGTTPKHTFFRHNGTTPTPPAGPDATLTQPFNWLVHLDRPLVSVGELLHVAGVKPHEVTQEFVGPSGQYRHSAPWLDQNARLYRALEWLTTAARERPAAPEWLALTTQGPVNADPSNPQPLMLSAVAGMTGTGYPWSLTPGAVLVLEPNTSNMENVRVLSVTASPPSVTAVFQKSHASGAAVLLPDVEQRVAGRINLNTVWNEEVFQALVDANSANGFTPAQVTAIFNNLVTQRDGGRPFRGMAAGVTNPGDAQFPMGLGIDDTFLRYATPGNPAGGGLFDVPGATHPYQRMELLTKILNNVTTRSNVFAVWLTVGFFEVKDDSVRPVKMGQEYGRAEGNNVRRRLFAIIDRTNLTMPVLVGTTAGTVGTTGQATSVQVTATAGTITPPASYGIAPWQWQIQPGSLLTIDSGSKEETVVVSNVAGQVVTAMFSMQHAAGAPIRIRVPGSPGPQPLFDVRRLENKAVVPYFSIID